MKTYTHFLDFLIVLLLALSVNFMLSGDAITHSVTTRSGMIRTLIITWQTLFIIASFFVFLRYIAEKMLTSR